MYTDKSIKIEKILEIFQKRGWWKTHYVFGQTAENTKTLVIRRQTTKESATTQIWDANWMLYKAMQHPEYDPNLSTLEMESKMKGQPLIFDQETLKQQSVAASYHFNKIMRQRIADFLNPHVEINGPDPLLEFVLKEIITKFYTN